MAYSIICIVYYCIYIEYTIYICHLYLYGYKKSRKCLWWIPAAQPEGATPPPHLAEILRKFKSYFYAGLWWKKLMRIQICTAAQEPKPKITSAY